MSDDRENLDESKASAAPAIQPMPPAPQVVYVQQTGPPTNGLATAAMVLGILGLVLFWTFWLGIILGVLAVIFGAIGRSKAKAGAPNKGQATGGLIMGIISISIGVLFFALIFTSLFSESRSVQDQFGQASYCVRHPQDPTC